MVDPSEAGPVNRVLEERGLTLTHILCTHHHADHTGGNLALKEQHNAQVRLPELCMSSPPPLGYREADLLRISSTAHPLSALEIPPSNDSMYAPRSYPEASYPEASIQKLLI